MKTKEELNSLKEEVETVNSKLRELADEELEQILGGISGGVVYWAKVRNLSDGAFCSNDSNLSGGASYSQNPILPVDNAYGRTRAIFAFNDSPFTKSE